MLEEKTSKLKLYSLGIVVKDKPRTTNTIVVTPIEELSYVDGKLSEPISEVNQTLPDILDEKEKIEGKIEKNIEAIWLALGHSNRSTSPDVIAGETVLLLAYADNNTIYWTTLFDEPSIRRLETVRYSYGNLKSGKVKYTKDTSYWTEYSTHDQYIWTRTSNSNNEKYIYDYKIDTANSLVTINDDVGNKFKIESKDTRITIENAMGTKYIQEETRITEHADESITITTNDYSLTANNTIKTETSIATHTANANYNITAPIVGISASTSLSMNGSGVTMHSDGVAEISATQTTAKGLFSFTQGGGRDISDITTEIDRLWEAINGLR